MNTGAELWRKAKTIISGGNQLLSKRAEMFLPDEWVSYYSKAKGANVWDLDGKKYLDMSISGVGCCALGHADDDVDNAVIEAIKCGNMSTLNPPEEVELAELLCSIHKWANMARFARTGGEAMAIAVRIIRAYTGNDKILFCGYHGWHDWYLSANLAESTALDGQLLKGLEPAGVPRGLYGTAIPFIYNDTEAFEEYFNKHYEELAGVVMEVVRSEFPKRGFLETIRRLTLEKGIPLVFDEVTSGLRMITGGVHLLLGISPDVAVFAKALGNGYPIAAIIGNKEIMQASQKTFISSTYWSDKLGYVAALATLKKHKEHDVGCHLCKMGGLVQDGWKQLGIKHDIKMKITGIEPLSHLDIEEKDSQLIHTLITSRMLNRGFLTSKSFYPTYAHTKEDVDNYLGNLNEVLIELKPYIHSNSVPSLPHGEIAHSGFQRLA